MISIDTNGKFDSSLYRKPSAGNTILHARSFHPDSLVKSIPYSQYLRLKRNCSRDSDFQASAKDLYDKLRVQGFSHTCLKRAYNRVNVQKRDSLNFASKPPKKVDTVRVITRYSNQHNEIRKILNRFWPLLSADPVARKYIKDFPEITFRRFPSLKDRLAHSHFNYVPPINNQTNRDISPCGHCDVCEFVDHKYRFLLPNGKWQSTKSRITC